MGTMIAATPENERERLEALRRLDLLDTAPEPEFDELVSLASAICEVPISVVSLIDEDRQWFKAQTGLGVKETSRAVAFCTHTIQQTDLMVVEDTSHDARFADNPMVTGEAHVRFYAGIPVSSPDGHAVGTLCIIDKKPRKLTSGQMTALRILGSQVNARLELRVQRKKLESALEEAEEARLKLTASEERFRLFMNNSPIVSHIKDADGRLVFYNQMFCERFGIHSTEWLGKTPAELWPAEEAEIIRRSDEEVLSGRIFRAVRQSMHEHDGQLSYWKSYKFPLTASDGLQLIGSVGVEITEDLRREEALKQSRQELETLNQQLQNQARTDALTGLFNRRGFDERLHAEFTRAARKGSELSVMVLDVDNFKRRNDSYGHPAGDATLRQLAQVLETAARAADIVARYGGEEFIVLLPETSEDQAMLCADRVLSAIREAQWQHEPVTASIGVSSLHASTRSEQRMVALADEALYVAKRTGKDRAVGYSEYFAQVVQALNPASGTRAITVH